MVFIGVDKLKKKKDNINIYMLTENRLHIFRYDSKKHKMVVDEIIL
jgi:hypothetical protein